MKILKNTTPLAQTMRETNKIPMKRNKMWEKESFAHCVNYNFIFGFNRFHSFYLFREKNQLHDENGSFLLAICACAHWRMYQQFVIASIECIEYIGTLYTTNEESKTEARTTTITDEMERNKIRIRWKVGIWVLYGIEQIKIEKCVLGVSVDGWMLVTTFDNVTIWIIVTRCH